MRYRIQITIPAKQDASDYAAFIHEERSSPQAAQWWLDGLHEAIKKLGELPGRFSVIPEAEELGFPYRSFRYHSHRVVYAVHETKRRVTVHRIYHSARKPRTEVDMEL